MKKTSIASCIFLALYSCLQVAYAEQKLIVFGDSLSDTGNIMRFTYNQGKIYNEHLANYFGYDFPAHSGNFFNKIQYGPNYALGGAVANSSGLKASNTWPGSWFNAPQTANEIDNFIKHNAQGKFQTKDTKFVYWIGGNDLARAYDQINLHNPRDNKVIKRSVVDVEKQLKKLMDVGGRFLIVPNAPNIANTPSFTLDFIKHAQVNLDGKRYSLLGRTGRVSEELMTRFLDDQNNQGKSPREVIYAAFEMALKRHYGSMTKQASRELTLWKQTFNAHAIAQRELVRAYNQGVDKAITRLQQQYPDVVIYRPDIETVLDDIMAHYQEFGFNNISGAAAKPFSSKVLSWGAGNGRVAAFEPEDGKAGQQDKPYLWNKGYHFVYADPFHPSPKVHRMIYEYMVSLLESESGDPTDLSVVRSSTQILPDTQHTIYRNAEGDGVFTAKNPYQQINKENINIFNDGRALLAENGGKITLDNFTINTKGRIGGIINAEKGGKITLQNGSISVERTNPYAAPFGIVINGLTSKVSLNNVSLNTYGKESTAISVGNLAQLTLDNSHISSEGVGANTLNLWGTGNKYFPIKVNNSSLTAKQGNAVRVFANDAKNREITAYFTQANITGGEYAFKIVENGTKNGPLFTAHIKDSQINGGIYTSQIARSTFLIHNSDWQVSKNSVIDKLAVHNTRIDLAGNSDNWQPKTLFIRDTYLADNARLVLGVDLFDDDSRSDKLVLFRNALNHTDLFIEKLGLSRGAKTKNGIKVIDFASPTTQQSYAQYSSFSLANEVTAGIYQYVLAQDHQGTDNRDYYLTSSYIQEDEKVIPVVQAVRKNRVKREVVNTTTSVAKLENNVGAGNPSITSTSPGNTQDTPTVENVHTSSNSSPDTMTDQTSSNPSTTATTPVEQASSAENTTAVSSDTQDTQTAESIHTSSDSSADTMTDQASSNPSATTTTPAQEQTSSTESAVVLPQNKNIKYIYNSNSTLYVALPYVSHSLSQTHIELAKPTALNGSNLDADYWINATVQGNKVEGEDFLRIAQNTQALTLGKILLSDNRHLFGISASYSHATNKVDNNMKQYVGLAQNAGKINSKVLSLNGYSHLKWGNFYNNLTALAAQVQHTYIHKDESNLRHQGYIFAAAAELGYRYPINQHLNLFAQVGVQSAYHRYSALTDQEISIAPVRQTTADLSAKFGVGYQVANLETLFEANLIKNLKDFDYLIMNDQLVSDYFTKDKLGLSLTARYNYSANVSLYSRLQYIHALPKKRKLKELNYKAGIDIAF